MSSVAFIRSPTTRAQSARSIQCPPLRTRAPFNWKDFTVLARLALDEFVLWVNVESPFTTALAYLQAAKENPGKFKMGGTGTAQEDQIITVQLEQGTGAKFIPALFLARERE